MRSTINLDVRIQVKDTLQTNYYGLVSMCEKFAPMIKDGGRIVNVSSLACKSGKIKSNSLRAKFHDPNATPKDITALMEKFQVCTTKL